MTDLSKMTAAELNVELSRAIAATFEAGNKREAIAASITAQYEDATQELYDRTDAENQIRAALTAARKADKVALRAETLRCLEAFARATSELARAWDHDSDYQPEVAYPAMPSFDDFHLQVLDWCEELRNSVSVTGGSRRLGGEG